MTTFQKSLIQRLAKSKAKKQNGFTLIELMVVVAIVGVLSAVGLPELLKAQDSAKDSAALQETVAAAKTCSMDLLTGGESYKTAVTGGTTWSYVTSLATACVADADGETEITGEGPTTEITITLTDGVPAKPFVDDK